MSHADHESQLRWLLLVRITVAISMLAAAGYIRFLVDAEWSSEPLVYLIAAICAVSVLYFFLNTKLAAWRSFVALQLSVDILFWTVLIYYLGAVRSPFVLLYLLSTVAAGLMLSRQGALFVASLAGICYGAMTDLIYLEVLRPWGFETGGLHRSVGTSEMYFRILAVLLSAYGVAWISSSLAKRLHRTRSELRVERVKHGALQQLNAVILQSMSSGLLAVNREGQTVSCNRAASLITGRSEEDLLGLPVWELFEMQKEMLTRFSRRLQDQRTVRTEQTLRASDGSVRTIGMSVTRVYVDARKLSADVADGSATSNTPRVDSLLAEAEDMLADGYIFAFQDLTEIKRMEQRLRVRERMALLGEMAGSMAHEIRNPLASISGSVQMLRRGESSPAHPSSSELMDIVVQESERLSQTIECFLDYARPARLNLAETDLLRLARETLMLLRNSSEIAPDHSLEVEPEVGEFSATVDADKIKQVFWNMARNAIQAMPQGGMFRIRMQRADSGALEVIFEDTGIGMRQEKIDCLFQPFYSAAANGTGLSLAVVYRILQQHGIRVEVDSEPGKGTRFVLLIETGKAVTEYELAGPVVASVYEAENRRRNQTAR